MAGLFALLWAGSRAASVVEHELADLHGPAGLIVLVPAGILYTAGALSLLIIWTKSRGTRSMAMTLTMLAPTAVLIVLLVRACWLIAAPAG